MARWEFKDGKLVDNRADDNLTRCDRFGHMYHRARPIRKYIVWPFVYLRREKLFCRRCGSTRDV